MPEHVSIEQSFKLRATLSGFSRQLGGLTLTGLADPAQETFFVCAEVRSDIASPPADEADDLHYLATTLDRNIARNRLAVPEAEAPVVAVVKPRGEAAIDIELTAAGFKEMASLFPIEIIQSA